MADAARFGYMQARLQARHGQRPSADDWQLAEASVDLAHFLDAVRTSSLKRWVRAVSSDSSAMEIEALMRMAWRDAVAQSASWAPQAWREAVLWLRWLPDLPALAHLLSGQGSLPWMRVDPFLTSLAFDDPAACLDALKQSPLAPMSMALEAKQDVVSAWLEAWRALQPDSAAVRAETAELDKLVAQHVQAMADAEAEAAGPALRRALAEQFTRYFRRGAGTIMALFGFLGLEGLELERVRANLVTRRLLRQVPEGRSWA